jgi:NodT family efflux transporter outer membrane factor (OMF) lipoprotein
MANNRQSDNRPLRSAGQPTYYSDHLVGASLGYELDLFGRVRNLVAAGRAGSEAARAEMESVKLSLRAELANDYISLRGADSELKFLNDIVESYSEAEMLTVSRFEGGITSELDVSRAKAQIDFARAKLSETSARRTLLEHAIATLTGESASTFSLPSGSLDLKVPSIPLGIPSTLLQRRPDIAAAERRVAAANSQIGIAKAAWFPTFFLGGAGGFESASVTGWLTAPDIFWSLGPQALVTLFDAGYRKAELNRVEAVLAESSAQYRGIVLRAFEEVEDNLTLLYEYEKESKDLEAEIRDTRRSVEIATNRYREGVANYLEVVTAQTANFQAELDDLTLRERRLHAEINLVRALGGGWNMTN